MNIPEQKCPYCGYTMNQTTSMDERRSAPKENVDVSICAKCGEVCIFGTGLTLRKPTPEELVEISKDPMIQKIQRRIVLYGLGVKR